MSPDAISANSPPPSGTVEHPRDSSTGSGAVEKEKDPLAAGLP